MPKSFLCAERGTHGLLSVENIGPKRRPILQTRRSIFKKQPVQLADDVVEDEVAWTHISHTHNKCPIHLKSNLASSLNIYLYSLPPIGKELVFNKWLFHLIKFWKGIIF